VVLEPAIHQRKSSFLAINRYIENESAEILNLKVGCLTRSQKNDIQETWKFFQGGGVCPFSPEPNVGV
jgi:hypothetical protein